MVAKKIILHHSLTKDSQTVSWGAIRAFHKETLRWKDIGYHFGIELVGSGGNSYYEILVGRMIVEIGAHCEGENLDSLGVCFVGNFDVEEVPPEQWLQGVRLVKSLCKLFFIPPEKVYGHREFNPNKSCPGKNFNLDGFRFQLLAL